MSVAKSVQWDFSKDEAQRQIVKMTMELEGLPALMERPVTVEQICANGFDERVIRTVLSALNRLESPAVEEVTPGHYQWVGEKTGQRDLHGFEMQRRWFHLKDAVRTGKPAGTLEPWFLDILTDAIRVSARELAPLVVDFVKAHIQTPDHGIDVGGSHGVFSETLLPLGHRMTILDLPFVVEKVRPTMTNVHFIGQDIVKQPLAATSDPFGFAIMVRFLHMLGPADMQALAKNIRPAMRQGAKIVVVDTMRGISPNADVFGVHMSLNTPYGNTYSVEDLEVAMGLRCLHVELLPQLGYAAAVFRIAE